MKQNLQLPRLASPRRFFVGVVLSLSLLPGISLAQTPERLGEAFQVNTDTSGLLFRPALAHDGDGNSVVVWSSEVADQANVDYLIKGQRLDSLGNRIGNEFQVATSTLFGTDYPDVAMDSSGRFVVAWHADGGYGASSYSLDIEARRFAADGSPLGASFAVHTPHYATQQRPAVATEADGDFIVVWESSGEDTCPNCFLIRGRRFASNGSPQGEPFQVSTNTTSPQRRSELSLDQAGNFVVVWQNLYPPYPGGQDIEEGVFARRFDSSATALGGPFQVNQVTTSDQTWPAVDHDGQGRFLVVWESDAVEVGDNSPESVQGRRYGADGSPLDGQFLVNFTTLGSQYQPHISRRANGDFVAVWQGYGNQGGVDQDGIHGRRFTSDGNPLGDEFLVNLATDGVQTHPRVTFLDSQQFLVVWQQQALIPGGKLVDTIQGQIFCDPNCLVFQDGFESGDVTEWSSAAGQSPR